MIFLEEFLLFAERVREREKESSFSGKNLIAKSIIELFNIEN